VPESVLVSLSAWNTFVDREATPEKLAQRLKAKDNRSKKTDAHYLGRTSYAEKEERWPVITLFILVFKSIRTSIN